MNFTLFINIFREYVSEKLVRPFKLVQKLDEWKVFVYFCINRNAKMSVVNKYRLIKIVIIDIDNNID